MMDMKKEYRSVNTQLMAVAAVMIALVAVLTLWVRIPIPATGGYVHMGDVGVFFAAFAFGPLVGLVAGGTGTALADVIGGYAAFAPLTLVAHGLQGWLAGYLGRGRDTKGLVAAWAVGGLAVVLVYFLGEWLVYGLGYSVALAEVIPNLMQVGVGGLVGVPLTLFVRRAYPPILRFGTRQTWRED